MSTIHLDLEDDLMTLLRAPNRSVENAIREMIALELYRRGTISSGKAAEILGVPKIQFIKHASQLGIPYFNMTEQELDSELSQLASH